MAYEYTLAEWNYRCVIFTVSSNEMQDNINVHIVK
jgi:hypothetical protein